MKYLFLRISFLFLLCAPVSAADWAMRAGDRALSAGDVRVLTGGRTLIFYDDGQSAYGPDDRYSYTYASGQSAPGRYRIEADGTVCIDYLNGFSRCDRYVENAGRIILLTEKGQRFPVREKRKN